MADFILNFSCEDFIPSKKCFFIKRISNVDDDLFLYYLQFYLEKYNFDGVVYVGEEISGVLDEYFSQELWEKSVMMKINVIGFYLVGEGVDIQNETFKDRFFFIQNCKYYRIENKKVTYNSTSHPVESEKSLLVLEKLVKILVKNANEEAGE